jgi:CRISPR-associated protein Cas2
MDKEKNKVHKRILQHSHTQRWLIAHDIADPKRLQKVWRFMQKEGVRLQYSVYLFSGSREQLDQVLDKLNKIVNNKEDDVRIYAITENTRIWGLGIQFNDGGNALYDTLFNKLIMDEPKVLMKVDVKKDLNIV